MSGTTAFDRLEYAKEQIKDSSVLVYRTLTRYSIGASKIHVEEFKVIKDNNILFELHFDDSYKYSQKSYRGEEINLWFGKTISPLDELTILPEHIDHYSKGILLRGEKVSKEYDDLTKMYKTLKNMAANQKRKMKNKNR